MEITIFYSLIGLPDTFGQLAKKVLDSLPEAKRVDFVTDSYKPGSIKDDKVEMSLKGFLSVESM